MRLFRAIGSWGYVFGSATLIRFMIQIVTGICLAVVYRALALCAARLLSHDGTRLLVAGGAALAESTDSVALGHRSLPDRGTACYPNKGVRHQSMKMYTGMCA
jgi:hypothetical protein